MDIQKIGSYIAYKRKAKGMTQDDLGKLLGLTNKAVSKWENGKCLPDASLFEDLCKALDMSLNELMAGHDIESAQLSEVSEQNIEEVLKAYQHLKPLKEICIGLLLLFIGRFMPLTQLKDTASEASQFIFGVSEGVSIGITLIGIAVVIMGLVEFSKQD